ncbi:hypothetical protein AOCH_005049 [Aspergillus ochraceoroseus]|uniref:Uncharacterized protein n=1 Tax=Aspergillus ochraceoroseus TaxID=138278 RepID=A0A0F8X582_9EURO|nr:hypothetical protein AOCH_005049 [Aspergillus ochraceoroseus]
MTSPTSTTTSPSSSSLPSTSSQSAFTPSSYFTSIARRRQQKKMSITQTYYLAHTARKKLTREASRPDHDLRLLVGHANLLDSLMLDLADAEQEQELPTHQMGRSVVEEPGDDWDPEDASDADSDDSDFEDDYTPEPYKPVRRRAPSPVAIITETELDEEEDDSESDSDSDFEYDNAEDLDELALTRSHSRQSPPELLLDEDEDSEDDTMPPSPSQPILETFDNKQMQTTEIPFTDSDFEHGYYVPAPTQGPMIEAC